MADPDLVLRSTPPRLPRTALARPRLETIWSTLRDHTAVVFQAPSGFGKTTLLLQWRRRWLEQGGLVAWLTLGAQDDPARFAQALLHTLRVASGRSSFGMLSTQIAGQPGRDLDALTTVLSAIADLATPTVLMLDEAENLPQATVERSLAYLLVNAPSNLQLVISTRTPLPISTTELLASGTLTVLSKRDLRLDMDESIGILNQRFGDRLTLDDRVRLHEVTGGWPIGLQLAAAAIERERDLHAAVQALSARRGTIERFFMESLLSRLPAAITDFLSRIAILDDIAPESCEAVTRCGRAVAYVDQLMADTPILLASEKRDWIRMHPLAKDFLLSRFERLPPPEQAELHGRASEWFETRGQFHEAGRHALAAGDITRAQTCALRSLWDLARMGKIAEARDWLDRIPQQALDQDIQLQLVAAWIMALGDRADQGLRIADRVLQRPSLDEKTHFVATLVSACAAVFTDKAGRLQAIMKPYPGLPPTVDDPVHKVAHANTLAALALCRDEHQEARRIEANVQGVGDDWSTRMALGLRCFLVGMSHLLDGNVYKADATLQQPLIEAENMAGRRCALAGMYAAVLAAVAFERNRPDIAEELLANRLDVIERTATPDAILDAYQTLARVALAQGDERRALAVLENLRSFADARKMPRLKVASLAEEIRIHALGARPETASKILEQLKAMRTVFNSVDHAPLRSDFDLNLAISQAYSALAGYDASTAEQHLKRAETLATRLHRGREIIVIKTLRAVVADALGNDGAAAAVLKEASGLAALSGLSRVIADAHPRAQQMLDGPGATIKDPPRVAPTPPVVKKTVGQGGLLTPKEAQILGLLDANFSNKHIARTMDVSGETVKWHLKNLFSKLDAGSRRHAVDRARLLGLLET